MTPTEPAAPPGWYGDPWRISVQRWWDGYGWTGYIWPTGPSPADLYADERKMVPYARVAFIGWVVVIAVGLLIAQIDSHPLRAYVDAVRSDIQSNDVTNPPHLYLPVGGYLNGLLQIPVYVGILIWQFRAAKTARDLRLWAKHSPALGTWSWIIPIVNFWFPYQAIRDCLPGDDPDRASVAWMWVFFIGMTVSNLAAIALIFAGSSAGAVMGAVALGFGIGFATMGVRSVTAISKAHHRLAVGV